MRVHAPATTVSALKATAYALKGCKPFYFGKAESRDRLKPNKVLKKMKNFDEIKAQLRELAEIVNSFKSEAVQLRIVDLAFGVDSSVNEEEAAPPPRREPPKRGRRRSKNNRNDETN
ncbi:MAG: hypothetical protein ACRD5Z_02355, partial [Bryobacteraceae bacterium]